MKKPLRFLLPRVAAALLALSFGPAHAAIDLVGDDTDLFTTNPNIGSQTTNMLIILDNTSNWSNQSQHWPSNNDQECIDAGITGNQQGDAEICALYKTIPSLDESVNLGLMMFNDQSKGAYVRIPMMPMNDANKILARDILKQISTNNPQDKTAANSTYDAPLNDAFRYLNSYVTVGGASAAAAPAHPGGYADAGKTIFKMFDKMNDDACGNDFLVFVGNGFPNGGSVSPAIDAAAALHNDPGVVVNKTALNNTGANADIWSRFLFEHGIKVADGVYRGVTTHTIDVCKDQCQAEQETLLKSMAEKASDGTYYKATDMAQIEAAFKDIFKRVQATESVFAATTLPVSINVRGTNLNQIYIGVFRPDDKRSPRWLGNLKQYKLGVKDAETGLLELRDGEDVAAVELTSGFIKNTATSIWTQDSTFWSYRAPFAQQDAGEESDQPDGDLVEKGGAAQKIRQVYDFPDSTTEKTRNIYTCTGTCSPGSQLKDFLFNGDNAEITAQQLGTFAGKKVSLLTASGTTATATVPLGHGFVAGDTVVVAGAVPNLFNGTFTIVSAPTATTFTYTISPAADATRAYVTQPGYTLVPGTDFVTISGAVPVEYNVANAAVEAVVGNVNQFAYAISGSPATRASGYTITGHRRVAAGNLLWDSSGGRATVTLPNHGYNSLDQVTISGATQPEFNVPAGSASGVITKIDNHTFTYQTNGNPAGATVQTAVATTAEPTAGANPFTWSPGDRVRVRGGADTIFYTQVASTPEGANIGNLSGNTFSYATRSTLLAGSSAAPGYTAERVSTTDRNTWTVTGASVASSAITLTLTNMVNLVPGQLAHPFVAGDSITVNNLICRRNNGNVIACLNGGTAGAISFTATVTAANNSAVTVTFGNVSNQVASFTINNPATAVWNASPASPTFSKAVVINTLVAGAATVIATGTVFSSKAGDLTTKVTSISSGAVATGTITAALASSGDPAARDSLIKWMRGMDNKQDENKNLDTTDIRASVHGDVLHSRPAVVNYNRNGDDNDILVFYGGNDGLLHAIRGGSLASGGGKEQWAFVPQEFFGKLKRLREQTPTISSFTPREYFFDGPIGVYTRDVNKDGKLVAADGDKVYLFIAMRRGGRMLYALDVSNPADPRFMWKRGCREATGNGTATGSGGCDAGFGEMGQTWSEPKLGYLRNWPDTLALMVAAGFDAPAEDPQSCFVKDWDSTKVTAVTGVVPPVPMDESTCLTISGSTVTKSRSMGRGIFVLNALTGDILWRAGPESGAAKQIAGMTFAMPGDLAVMRSRSNIATRTADLGIENVLFGYVDRIYATDTGGIVWRFDVSDASGSLPPKFIVTQLASVAVAPQTGTHPARDYRKFLVSPDVVYSSDATGPYDAVLLGSGDREHPFDMVVRNRFYMFKDRNVGSLTEAEVSSEPTPPDNVISDSSLFDVTNNCLQDAANCASGVTQEDARSALLAARGWKLDLSSFGEKTVAPATTAAGTVIFNTHEPTDRQKATELGVCRPNLGIARQYGLNFQDGTATRIFNLPPKYVSPDGRTAMFAGGGFLPTPVPVVVQINGQFFQTVVAGVQTTNPGGLKLQTRVRTYWNRKVD